MEIREKFVRGYENKSFAELAVAPLDALKGISKKDAQMLFDAFHIRTIADLANLKFARWAREICELADLDPHGDTTSFKDKLIKKYEKTPPIKLAKAPVWALQGVSQKDAALLRKAFAIKTIRDFASLKYIAWAQEVVDCARPQSEADIPVDQTKKPLRAIAAIILLTIVIIALFVFWPQLRSLISERYASTPSQLPPFGERIVPTSKLETKQNGDVSKKHVQLPIQPKGDEERRTSVGSNTACDNCYTVKWQDTLIKISERLSGDWRNWKKLYDLNRDAVKSTRLLIPGTQLKLPEGFNTTNEN